MRWCWTVLAAHLSWIEGSALCAAVLATWATVAAGSRPRRLLWRQSSARSPNRAHDAGYCGVDRTIMACNTFRHQQAASWWASRT